MTIEGCLLGIHGYGQFYRDIFRTIANRGQKSPEEVALLMERFSGKAGRDLDLRVALWALGAGIEGDLSLDARRWDSRVEELLAASLMHEKNELSARESATLKWLARLAGIYPQSVWRRYRQLRGLMRSSA